MQRKMSFSITCPLCTRSSTGRAVKNSFFAHLFSL